MKKLLILCIIGLLSSTIHAQWTQMGTEITGSSPDDRIGTSLSISSDGLTFATGAPYNDDGPTNAGQVQVYDWDGTDWAQRGNDINGVSSADTEATERYLKLSSNGNTVVIGAIANDGGGSNSGHVRVFDWDGSTWVQRGNNINGEAADDYSGSVSISSDTNTIAIGAVGNDGGGNNAGHVRIFDWNGGAWVQRGLDINGGGSQESSGESVDLSADGNSVVIGSTDGEVVRIMEWNGSSWVQKGSSLYAEVSGDYFGQDLDLTPDGNTIIIGAQKNDANGFDSGQVRVYDWNGTNWVQRGTDLDGDNANDWLGTTVSISSDGNTIAAGAYMNSDNGISAGKVKTYHWDGSNWVADSDILLTSALSYFGTTVSLSANGEILAIGAMGHSSNRGLVAVFGVPSCNSANSLTIDVCDSYTVPSGDETYSTLGSYTVMDTIPNAQACDSILTINLSINSPSVGSETISTCNSFTWPANDITYDTTGIYTATLINALGCDSTVTLDLTMGYSNTGTDVQSACDSYMWIDGNTYEVSNSTATHTLTNASACDSVVTLNLTIGYSNTGTDVQSACDSYTWIDGNTYEVSNSTATHTLTNTAGCDSVVTLNLTIGYSNTGTDVQSACDSYTWIDGNTYEVSDSTSTHTLTNTAGCDSTVTLNLTIGYSNEGTDVQSACDSYTWIDGNTYDVSNTTATHTLTNTAGCDSIITLNLTINTVSTSVTQAGTLLTANESGASYQWLDCPGMTPINDATDQSYTAIVNGDYAVTVTINECSGTSDCYTVMGIGIIENDFGHDLVLFPNPTDGYFSIDIGDNSPLVIVTLTDLSGKFIRSKTFTNETLLNLEIEEPPGVYLLVIQSGGNEAVIRLVKE